MGKATLLLSNHLELLRRSVYEMIGVVRSASSIEGQLHVLYSSNFGTIDNYHTYCSAMLIAL